MLPTLRLRVELLPPQADLLYTVLMNFNVAIVSITLLLSGAMAASAADSDRDGVVDALDQCPESEPGAPVTMRGCSYDTDQDGVPDYRDDCQDSAAGAPVDAYGCQLLAEIELPGLSFESNSAHLKPGSELVLDAAAARLLSYQDLQAEVAGHTDDRGSASHNRKLSRHRAEAVRNYLVRAGVSATALSARGYGESRPVASNDDEQGRAANRRVVIRVLAGRSDR